MIRRQRAAAVHRDASDRTCAAHPARRCAPPNAMARTSVESMLKTLNLMAYYDNFKIVVALLGQQIK